MFLVLFIQEVMTGTFFCCGHLMNSLGLKSKVFGVHHRSIIIFTSQYIMHCKLFVFPKHATLFSTFIDWNYGYLSLKSGICGILGCIDTPKLWKELVVLAEDNNIKVQIYFALFIS